MHKFIIISSNIITFLLIMINIYMLLIPCSWPPRLSQRSGRFSYFSGL